MYAPTFWFMTWTMYEKWCTISTYFNGWCHHKNLNQPNWLHINKGTIPETNIAPGNWWFEDDPFLLGPGLFSEANCEFRGVYVKNVIWQVLDTKVISKNCQSPLDCLNSPVWLWRFKAHRGLVKFALTCMFSICFCVPVWWCNPLKCKITYVYTYMIPYPCSWSLLRKRHSLNFI